MKHFRLNDRYIGAFDGVEPPAGAEPCPAPMRSTDVWVDGSWRQSPEQLRREIMDGVQRYLDDFAQTKAYDNILSACTYATSTVPRFAAEGQYCVQARDACWDVVASIEAEVMAGNRPAPSGFEDIRAELPALSWPANLDEALAL
ncbi:hypothetical protein B597_022205 [Stutzerimonas stutzeri KOS6]|uniref:Uncharacterized protein n=2 Tax=Stutzerimonas stutzeri TaxID=316 RepID=A0A061JJ67_STUST|nr:hypothetical protein B597_022205 [Stutzerimonas stutzeri KOS6]